MEREIARLNWHEFKQTVENIDGVILPVGTVEVHGCTNLGTDITIPEFLAKKLADRLDLLIAPTINYGITRTLLPYAGSMTVSPESFENYAHDVAVSLVESGFKFVVFLNGHGGHIDELARLALKLWRETGAKSIVLHWWQFCEPLTREILGESGGHSALDETYMVMAADESLVAPELSTPETTFLVREGAYPYPNAGLILQYKEGEGTPRFDKDEADRYAEAVVDYIERYIREVLAGWLQNGV